MCQSEWADNVYTLAWDMPCLLFFASLLFSEKLFLPSYFNELIDMGINQVKFT